PEPAILSENSSAPNMLSVSVSASAGWRSAFANSPSLAILIDPFSREYAEWTWRCKNPALDGSAAGFYIVEVSYHWLKGTHGRPQKADSRRPMVKPRVGGVHVER